MPGISMRMTNASMQNPVNDPALHRTDRAQIYGAITLSMAGPRNKYRHDSNNSSGNEDAKISSKGRSGKPESKFTKFSM
jgi:hypothetical protein